MLLACDATAIKRPLTGVQNAVRHQLEALTRALTPQLATPLLLARRDLLPDALAQDGAPRLAQPPACVRHPLARILWQQTHLPFLLRRLHADALYAFAYTAPLACPVPYILNVHDTIALDHPELCARLNRWQMRLLLPASIRGAALCVASTQHGADAIMCRLGLPASRIRVISLGVDAARFAAPAPPPDGLQERPYLLFLSNIEPKKGLNTLLDAYAKTADRLDADLVIVGRAAWKSADTIRRLRDWRGPGRLRWLHYVPDDRLPALYQHAHAFVMPSLVEGFGLPILEAMAAGTPVIHSDHPALMEAADGAGLPFRVQDSDSLADALLRLHGDDHGRQTLIQAGRRHADRRSWRRWGELAAQCVAELASRL